MEAHGPQQTPLPDAGVGIGRRIAGAAVIIGAGTLAAFAASLLRERAFGQNYGLSRQTDAFVVAYRLPFILQNILAAGLLPGAVIPIVSGMLARGHRGEASRTASGLFLTAASVLGLATLVGLPAAPFLIGGLGSGLEPAYRDQAVAMTRIMLPIVFFLGLAIICQSILYAWESFLVPAFTMAVYRLTTALLIFWWGPRMGIYGAAWAETTGAVASLALNLPVLMWHVRAGIRRPSAPWSPRILRILSLALPIFLTLLAQQVPVVVETWLGSGLPHGKLTTLQYGYRLSSMAAFFLPAVAMAMLPALSRLAALGDRETLSRTLEGARRITLFLNLGLAVAMVVLARPIIAVILAAGVFARTPGATEAVSYVFIAYLISLLSRANIHIATRGFYAIENPTEPLRNQSVTAAINTGADLLFVRWWQAVGLALGNSVSVIFSGWWLLVALRRALDQRVATPWRWYGGLAASAVVSAIGLWVWRWVFDATLGSGHASLAALGLTAAGLAVGFALYAGTAVALRVEGATQVFHVCRRAIRTRPAPPREI